MTQRYSKTFESVWDTLYIIKIIDAIRFKAFFNIIKYNYQHIVATNNPAPM